MSAHQLDRLARFRAMAERHVKRVGRAIQLRREDLGWSRPQLARAIPVADKTVTRWERGETGGASEQLDRIAKVMDTTSEAMMAAALSEERSDDPPADPPLEALSAPVSGSDLDDLRARLERIEQVLGLLLADRGLEQVSPPSAPAGQQNTG